MSNRTIEKQNEHKNLLPSSFVLCYYGLINIERDERFLYVIDKNMFHLIRPIIFSSLMWGVCVINAYFRFDDNFIRRCVFFFYLQFPLCPSCFSVSLSIKNLLTSQLILLCFISILSVTTTPMIFEPMITRLFVVVVNLFLFVFENRNFRGKLCFFEEC